MLLKLRPTYVLSPRLFLSQKGGYTPCFLYHWFLSLGSANCREGIFYGVIGILLAIVIVCSFRYFFLLLKEKKTGNIPPQKDVVEEMRQNEVSIPDLRPKKENLLWLQIEKAMNEHELWRDPDLTASKMIDKMNTNRTSFSNAIRDGGYDNFNHYLAHHRIEAFCKQAESEVIENIQDAFFKVGYQARTTAFTQFKKMKGMSPSKYIRINCSHLRFRNMQDKNSTQKK